MTVKKAIDILQKQKAKIDDTTHTNDDNWVFQTASYIKDFFGDKSTEYSFIAQFHFYVKSTSWDSDKDVSRWLSEKPVEAKKYLDNCIETLQHKGLVHKPNFLQRFSDNALWASISIILPMIWGFGFLIGQYTSDVKNFELRQENKSLKDSLSSLRPLNNKITNRLPDTIIQKAISNDTQK